MVPELKVLHHVLLLKVKVYTISKAESFDHPDFYRDVINELPTWLEMKNGFDSSNDKIAF